MKFINTLLPGAQRFAGRSSMKAFVLLAVIAFFSTSCQKDVEVAPKKVALPMSTASPSSAPAVAAPTTVSVSKDTIPDNAAFRMKLGKDSINTDETLIVFNHSASLNYSRMEDAVYMSGFGAVSLANVSHDGIDISIKSLPYTPGMSIGLDVKAKSDGAYYLKMSYKKNIPAGVQILLKDTYLKDSIDVRSGPYNFNISKADTNSFGRKRFKLIVKNI